MKRKKKNVKRSFNDKIKVTRKVISDTIPLRREIESLDRKNSKRSKNRKIRRDILFQALDIDSGS